MTRHAGPLALLLALTGGAALAVPPEEAHQHDGEELTFEFVVKGGKVVSSPSRGTYASLNSGVNHRAPTTLLVLIAARDFGKFSRGGPVDRYYLGKQIRVTGKVKLNRSGVPELWVSEAKNLQVTNTSPAPDPKDTPPPSQPLPDDFDPNPASYLWVFILGGGLALLAVALVIRQLRKQPEVEQP